jgi:hypothetical protein
LLPSAARDTGRGEEETAMRTLHGGPELPNLFRDRAGDRGFAPPEEDAEDASFKSSLRGVVTTVAALIAISVVSAICSIVFTICRLRYETPMPAGVVKHR